MKEWSSQPPKYGPYVWRGGAGLGSGSYGAAWAFYRDDGQGVVFDRIAVKDTVLRRDHWVSQKPVLHLANVAMLTFIQLDWVRWWGAPWDTKNREHMEIKVMQDIAADAKASRCVFIRGSEHHDDMYSMCTHPSRLQTSLTRTSLPNHHELLPLWIHAQGESWTSRSSGAQEDQEDYGTASGNIRR